MGIWIGKWRYSKKMREYKYVPYVWMYVCVCTYVYLYVLVYA